MPQFDFFSFFVQIFWLVVASCLFYLIYLRMPLGNSAKVQKLREFVKKFYLLNMKAGTKIKSNALYDKIVSKWFKK